MVDGTCTVQLQAEVILAAIAPIAVEVVYDWKIGKPFLMFGMRKQVRSEVEDS